MPTRNTIIDVASSFRLALCLFFTAIAATSLHAEKISAQFNEKTISADKISGKADVAFNFGKTVDFSKGTVSFWITPDWYAGSQDGFFLFTLYATNGNCIRLLKGFAAHANNKTIGLEIYGKISTNSSKLIGFSLAEIADWIPGQRHHVAATWSSDRLALYLDGVDKGTFRTRAAGPLRPDRIPFMPVNGINIGMPKTSYSDIRISDRALSSNEIIKQYQDSAGAEVMIHLPERPIRMMYEGETPEIIARNFTDQKITGKLNVRLTDFTDPERKDLMNANFNVNIEPRGTKSTKIEIPKNGLFQLTVELKREGAAPSQNNKVFGMGPRVDIKTLADSPFGFMQFGVKHENNFPLPLTYVGSKWIRPVWGYFTFWDSIQPKAGAWEWTAVDLEIEAMHQSGLNVLLDLGRSSKWASTAPEGEKDRSLYMPDLAAWAEYVETVTRHYRGKINYFLVWGEPNGGFMIWDKDGNKNIAGESEDPRALDALVELHRVAYAAAKKGNPECRVLGVGFQGFAYGFLEKLIKAGILKYVDIVAIDIYPMPLTPEQANMEEKLSGLIGMVRKADAAKPIWIPETGYATTRRRVTYPMPTVELEERIKNGEAYYNLSKWWGKRSLDEWTVANLLVRYNVIALASGVEKVISWSWEEYDSIVQTTEVNGSPHLAVLAFNGLSSELAGRPFLKKIHAANMNRHLYLFGDAKKQILTAWNGDAKRGRVVLKIDPAISSVTVVDIFGNRTNISLKNGLLELELDGSPKYLEGVGTAIACVNDPLSIDLPEVVADRKPIALRTNIENNEGANLNGILSYELPNQWSTTPDTATIAVANGEIKSYESKMQIPASALNGYFPLQAVCTLKGGGLLRADKNILLRIPQLCHPQADARANGAPLVLSNRSQVVKGLLEAGQAIVDAVDEWKGPADSSATILPGWDKDNLYLSIDVVDKSICTTMSSPWEGDCIELFIDEAGTKENIRLGVDAQCSQIFLIPEGEGKITCLKPDKIKGAKVSKKKTDAGYRLEVTLPWSNFPGIRPQRGAVFGFDAYVDNADPDSVTGKPVSKSTIAWEGKAGNCSDASRYGRIVLTE